MTITGGSHPGPPTFHTSPATLNTPLQRFWAALELRRSQWRDLLRGPHVQQARLILQHLIDLPIRIPNQPAPKFIRRGKQHDGKWLAKTRPGGLLVGLVQSLAFPTGVGLGWTGLVPATPVAGLTRRAA